MYSRNQYTFDGRNLVGLILCTSCAISFVLITDAISSYVRYPCHVQKIVCQSTPPHSPAPLFLLLHLSQYFLTLGGRGT